MTAIKLSLDEPAYELDLTLDEIQAIEFWRGRYEWPDACWEALDEDASKLIFWEEHEAWEWKTTVDRDAEGGHSRFPGIIEGFVQKLEELYDSIV